MGYNHVGEGRTSHRYRNSEINPDLEIPAGTKIGNETVKKNTTNLERMKAGKPPLVQVVDENGRITFNKIELHHLTSEERNRGSKYINGVEKEGAFPP